MVLDNNVCSNNGVNNGNESVMECFKEIIWWYVNVEDLLG